MQDRFYILRVPSYQKLQIKPIESPHITNTVNFTISDLETFWHFRLGHQSVFLLVLKGGQNDIFG